MVSKRSTTDRAVSDHLTCLKCCFSNWTHALSDIFISKPVRTHLLSEYYPLSQAELAWGTTQNESVAHSCIFYFPTSVEQLQKFSPTLTDHVQPFEFYTTKPWQIYIFSFKIHCQTLFAFAGLVLEHVDTCISVCAQQQ